MQINNIKELQYEYLHQVPADLAYLLLHGLGDGIQASYTQALLQKISGRNISALAINFPYMTRGDKKTSNELEEESSALDVAYTFLKEQGVAQIHIVAKSLGGIVAAHWLSQNQNVEGVDVSILGYVLGTDGVKTEALRGRMNVVVQGERDRFGNSDVVKSELRTHRVEGKVIEIVGADHSFRDVTNLEMQPPAFQNSAIDKLLEHI